MGLFQVVCTCLLAVIARAQRVLQDCSVDTGPLTIRITEDAAALAASLQCSNGDFAVEWVGGVSVKETLYVTGGTSLNITGAGPGALADGGGNTQLFFVDGGSTLHLSDITLANGNASVGGAVYAEQSSISFSGNTSFSSNHADYGGAIYANESTVSWNGDGTELISNSALISGGAIYAALGSIVSWNGDGTQFISNSADYGGAILAEGSSTVSWDGDGTEFSNNSALDGGAIFAASFGSTVSWDGDGTEFSNNSASRDGGAIFAFESSILSWDGDGTQFIFNSAGSDGGAIFAVDVSWDGDGTQFISNSADSGGAIFATMSTAVSWGGDGTKFTSNSAAEIGGAISASLESTVCWDGDGTQFISNSAGSNGGAIFAGFSSNVSWDGDGTQFISNSADVYGGSIFALLSSKVSWAGDGTQFISNSADNGGAISASTQSTVSWNGNGTRCISNHVSASGGAIHTFSASIVSWVGDGAAFVSNSAAGHGGAIYANSKSTVLWDGGGIEFNSNSVNDSGGAIYAGFGSDVSWFGDGTAFSNNSAGEGGAIYVMLGEAVSWVGDGTAFSSNSAGDGNGGAIYAMTSLVTWDGDRTTFSNNSAAHNSGGAIYAFGTNLTWDGDGTEFISNAAIDGGAIFAFRTNLSWVGDGTEFILNSASSTGGAIYAQQATASLDKNTTFSRNVAGGWGGALAMLESENEPIVGTAFIHNSAKIGGGIYLNNLEKGLQFTDVTFHSNSATSAGGAVVAHVAGNDVDRATFSRCVFSNNTSDGSGGAIETMAGWLVYTSCEFKGNSADIGGAMHLGGADFIGNCSFLSNSASTRGYAIAAVVPPIISGSSFDGNNAYCTVGSYRTDTEEEEGAARFQAACFECAAWDACSDCSITSGNIISTCEAPLEHTMAEEPGLTLETLKIDGGFWRTTTESNIILACYNRDACGGGLTGAENFCASGYRGPYCAVCENGYSPSLDHTCTRCSSPRRQGLVVATVIAALVAVLVLVAVFKFLLSTEVEEGNIGCFHRRVLRAVPIQALKIVVVVWQILTQFADAANTTYPGVYQDFLSAIDVVNFDIGSVLAAGCLWSGIDFHGRLLVSTIGPLVVVGFLVITYLIAMRKNSASGDTAAVEKIRHKHVTALLLLTFLVYSSVSSIVFQTFACETLDDGIEYLRADYRIHCTDAKHKALEVYAGIMVFVYPVGIPLLYAVLLFQRRDVLVNADADKATARPIADLWEAYRPERFYYEVIECCRRILLTGVVVFIFPNDAAQIAITMLIAFFFSLVFEVLAPYTSESDMWLSRGGHVIVFLSMFDLLLLKVDVSGERDQSQVAFAGVLVAGHVLMILAIVVEVVGIFFAARKEKVPKGGETSGRPRVGRDDLPVFESAPASWRSFFHRSVSEKTGPTRSISGTVVCMVGGA